MLHRSPIVPTEDGEQVLAQYTTDSDLCICTCVGDIYKPTRRPPGTIGLSNFSTYLPSKTFEIYWIDFSSQDGWTV